MTEGDLWARLAGKSKKPAKDSAPPTTMLKPVSAGTSKRRLRVAQVVASIAWLYLIIKLFIADVDYLLITRLFPESPWVLDLRIVVLAALFIATIHFFRKYAWWMLYIAFFPIIVIGWYIPLRLYKFWSWEVAIALTSILYSIGRSFTANLTARLTEICCIVLVSGVKPPYLMLPLAGLLLISLSRTYFRTFRRTFWPQGFLRAHASVARRILRSGQVMQWASVPDSARRSRAKTFNEEQRKEIAQHLSNALLAIKASDFYAYQLAKYRKSPAPFLLGILSYSVLSVYSVAVLTVVNLAIYKYSAAQFNFQSPPSPLTFIHYSLSALALNGIDDLSPVGDYAVWLKVISGFLGPLILATLLLNGYLSYRANREDEATREAIDSIKRDAGKIIERVEAEYQVTPTEALRRLQELGLASTVSIVIWFAAQVPEDFQDSADSS
ncbi:hypothetical protein AB0L30_29600 [Microbispora rosea]|uniref:hypothetical protein n=1 Tax=Microbispora rosea TaxID=58117 RepID=UPI00343DD4DD